MKNLELIQEVASELNWTHTKKHSFFIDAFRYSYKIGTGGTIFVEFRSKSGVLIKSKHVSKTTFANLIKQHHAEDKLLNSFGVRWKRADDHSLLLAITTNSEISYLRYKYKEETFIHSEYLFKYDVWQETTLSYKEAMKMIKKEKLNKNFQ